MHRQSPASIEYPLCTGGVYCLDNRVVRSNDHKYNCSVFDLADYPMPDPHRRIAQRCPRDPPHHQTASSAFFSEHTCRMSRLLETIVVITQ